jgi:uncharacterized protein YdiU (UPF0061 family)
MDMIRSVNELAQFSDYSLLRDLQADPQARLNGEDYQPREVFSGHYVPVKPTPIADPQYIAHSEALFSELGLAQELATRSDFIKIFSGDLSQAPVPMKKIGWATGYALSIFGREYYQQCPFQTGNGYGDGRAISVLETVIKGKKWEMQLKGGGRTPYCRGADGRAVLRSSVREFLAQEAMHALNVPTARSLCLYVSKSEKVKRPWYSEHTDSFDPDLMIEDYVAITTRVASSFLRVGQLELFGRRARKKEHPRAQEELEKIVIHLIDRDYSSVIDKDLPLHLKVLILANAFSERLTSLVANWIRVGYCQGNFNSDNCAAGGFTLDYGPFGFCEEFSPKYQPWTGGGEHFSFFNQPEAALRNFHMFCVAVAPLLQADQAALQKLEEKLHLFPQIMKNKLEIMWSEKLGLSQFDEALVNNLFKLMLKSSVDYTLFFRELSFIPNEVSLLEKCFYNKQKYQDYLPELSEWLRNWNLKISSDQKKSPDEISSQMKKVNPKYILREWLLAPAYQAAGQGDYSHLRELQQVIKSPYQELSKEIEAKYYRVRPEEFFNRGGVSHLSCSS